MDWTALRLGRNKEVLDAELFAIRRAMEIFLKGQEARVAYAVF